MRKLGLFILIAMISLFSTTSFAQEVKEEVKKEVKQMVQEKVEVQLNELPEAITASLNENYAEYKAIKAYKAKKEGKKLYYVKLEKDGQRIKVVYDAEGTIIKQKDITNSQSKLG